MNGRGTPGDPGDLDQWGDGWCFPSTPKRVWHRYFGEARVVAVRSCADGYTEYAIDFLWRGRKFMVEPWAQLVWLDDPCEEGPPPAEEGPRPATTIATPRASTPDGGVA